jgi:hypothetical protein
VAHDHSHPHDEWCRPLPELKALPRHASLARTQQLIDLQRLGSRPELLSRKRARMTSTPFGFLRGAAPLFDECLRREGSWGKGPAGGGSLVGDLHLENFGVFLDDEHRPRFHVNDFDGLRDGPWRFDVLRLLTSILLARTELQATGTQIQHLARLALEGHQAAMAGKASVAPPFVRRLLKAAAEHSPGRLLRKHLEGKKLVRDAKHPVAPAKVARLIPAALAQWASGLPRPLRPEQLEIFDSCRRVSGTGSLGAERLLVLVRGDAKANAPFGRWLLEVKEVRFGADRIVEAVRAAVTRAPALLGSAWLGESEVLVRRLSAEDEKLQLADIAPDDADAVIHFIGALAGQAHHRLARTRPAPWTMDEQRALLASARRLAAMHEEAFIEFSALELTA